MLANLISSLQNFALLLQIFALLFGINCTEIDQLQSSIISVYIIRLANTNSQQNINFFAVCNSLIKTTGN